MTWMWGDMVTKFQISLVGIMIELLEIDCL